jgi:uncharacterized membrane protein (UPF0127 family)
VLNASSETKANPARSLGQTLRQLFASSTDAAPDVRLQVKNLTRDAVIGRSVEVANTSAKRRKGLLGRAGLSQGEGLWISPCESVHTVGMQFPIDLVYLDRSNRVKKVKHAVPAWRLSGCLTAHSVIELPAGTNRETGTKPGDQLDLSPANQ